MSIILLSIPKYSSYFLPIKKNLSEMNYRVISYDYRHGDYLGKILRLLFGETVSKKYIEFVLFLICSLFKPDYLLTVKGESISSNLLSLMRSKGIRTINWFPDPKQYWKLIRKSAPYYDFFFHFDPFMVKRLHKIGYSHAYLLPFASENSSLKKANKIYEISFVGTYNKDREKKLKPLKNLGLVIGGDSRWLSSSLKDNVICERVSLKDMKQIILQSKININLVWYAPKTGCNLRTFEVTGVGGFLLCEYVEGLKSLYNLGKEVEVFRSSKELIFKVNYFLKNYKEREKIALLGYKRSKKDHNYGKRLKEMMDVVKKAS